MRPLLLTPTAALLLAVAAAGCSSADALRVHADGVSAYRLVNDRGAPRLEVQPASSSGHRIRLLCSAGERRVAADLLANGATRLSLQDEAGDERARVSVTAGGVPQVAFRDRRGNDRAVVRLDGEGSPVLTVLDNEGSRAGTLRLGAEGALELTLREVARAGVGGDPEEPGRVEVERTTRDMRRLVRAAMRDEEAIVLRDGSERKRARLWMASGGEEGRLVVLDGDDAPRAVLDFEARGATRMALLGPGQELRLAVELERDGVVTAHVYNDQGHARVSARVDATGTAWVGLHDADEEHRAGMSLDRSAPGELLLRNREGRLLLALR